MQRILTGFLLLALGSVWPAFAAPLPLYDLDPAHTRVTYRVSHLGFSMMPGTMHDIKGTVAFDPERVEESMLDVTINAKAITMNHGVLDEKLQGKEFFNTVQFPEITFKSTKVERKGTAKGTVTGNLTFLGVTKPVTLKVTFNKKAFSKYTGGDVVGFSASGKINRSDFGMKAYLPDVGDQVTLYIEAEAHVHKDEPTDNSRKN
jgi:polyisoprenoid-binding protein YceI